MAYVSRYRAAVLPRAEAAFQGAYERAVARGRLLAALQLVEMMDPQRP